MDILDTSFVPVFVISKSSVAQDALACLQNFLPVSTSSSLLFSCGFWQTKRLELLSYEGEISSHGLHEGSWKNVRCGRGGDKTNRPSGHDVQELIRNFLATQRGEHGNKMSKYIFFQGRKTSHYVPLTKQIILSSRHSTLFPFQEILFLLC